jgi:coenzyme F420-reducing hydrogenase alpha subunit
VKIEAGEGVGVTEAPRGTLYHHYKINERGLVEYANIITPTTQNLKNIEEDVKKLLPEIIDLPRGKMTLELEKLIRSYDPCISCATHFLQVNII